MYWINLEANGFAVSIEEHKGKKHFFLRKINDAADQYSEKINEIGFSSVPKEENLYTAPLTYVTRNKLLALEGASLFPTTIEAKHEDPFHGFRDIRTISPETPNRTLPEDVRVEEDNRGAGSIPGDDRRDSAGDDTRIVPGPTGSEPNNQDSITHGTGAAQQLVDENIQPSGDKEDDLSTTRTGAGRVGDGRELDRIREFYGPSQLVYPPFDISQIQIEDKKPKDILEPVFVQPDKNPNHHFLTDDNFWTKFSNKDRFEFNIEAIKTLKDVENREPPQATEEEKLKMAQYAGWGSVKNDWNDEQRLRREFDFTADEESSVFRSTLDAYYTSPVIVKSLWQSIHDQLGFNGGEVMEPAAGVGNFLGFAPKEIVEKSNFHGTELDTLSGRMAKQLYPDANLQIRGFEEWHPPVNYFDLAITNVPFGKNKPYDKNYKNSHSIHNYFICKSLELLKPGAIGVFVTSSYTMDSVGDKARREMNEKANLLSAVRMPVNALKDHSNVEVMMDVLIFQKRVAPRSIMEDEPDWINTHSSDYVYDKGRAPYQVITNEYFINHPEALAGTVSIEKERWNKMRRVVVADPDRPFEDLFPAILNATLSSPSVQELIKDNKKIIAAENTTVIAAEPKEELVELDSKAHLLGSFVKERGKIYQIKYRSVDGLDETTKGVLVTGNAKKLRRLEAFIDLKNTLNEHYKISKETEGDESRYVSHRALLNAKYESFVGRYGYLNDKVNFREIMTDPEHCKVITLEINDPESKKVKKASIFTERVLGKDVEITHSDSVNDAIALSLNKHNTINISYIAELCDKEIGQVIQELEGRVYRDPVLKTWLMADLYLSGNVRKKLISAQRAAEYDAAFKVNVEALEKVIPTDIPAEEISVRLGVPWVPLEDYKKFLADHLNVHPNHVRLQQKEIDGSWTAYFSSPLSIEKQTIEFGTDRKPFTDILKSSLHQRIIEVHDEIEYEDDDGVKRKKRVYNHKESIAAQHKQEELQNAFKEYLFFKDEKRTERMVRLYNDKMNAYVKPKYDGSHLTFPGLAPHFKPRLVQANAVYRALYDNTLLNHEVGVGKTFEQIAIAMEMRRLGLAKKPLMVVASHTLGQINKDAQELYPGKKILMLTKDDFKPANRKMFVGKIANNDWDLVIMGHSVFERIPMDKEFERAYIKEQISLFRDELKNINDATTHMNQGEANRFGAKAIARKLAALESTLQKLTDTTKDEGLKWSDLGIDSLLIDEAHRYKNLSITSSNSNIANLPSSKRATDLFLKISHLDDMRGDGKGVVFATGTPITNNPLEIYTMQRYLQMDELEEVGIARASDWYSNFLYPKVSWEPSHAGSGWKQRVRPCLQNVPELMSVFNSTMDTISALDAGIVRPEVQYITEVSPMSPIQKIMMQELDEAVRGQKEHIFTIMHKGRTMAIDPRLVLEHDGEISTPEDLVEYSDPEDIDTSYSKLNRVADRVTFEWIESTEKKGTQLIFSDMGVPNKDRLFTVYDEIKKKLIERGLPEHEIQFIHDHEDDKAKEKLFDQVRSGEVRVLLGSTEKLGTGTNVQDKIVAIHHVDAPWVPSAVEQRNGRGLRFGNENKDIRVYNYTTQDTFDLFQWNLLKIKNEQNKQILYGTGGSRTLDFEIEPTYAETAALTSGNPLIREKLEVEAEVTKMETLYNHFLKEKSQINDHIRYRQENIKDNKKGIERLKKIPDIQEDAVFKIKALKYDALFDDGKELEFEADDVSTVKKMLKMIREKTHRTRFLDDTLTFGDVPIKFYQKPLNYDVNVLEDIWEVGDDIKRATLKRARDTIIAKPRSIIRLEENIIDDEKNIAELREKLTTGFGKEQDLVELKIKFSNIVREIEKLGDENAESSVVAKPNTQAHEAVKDNNLAKFTKLCDENPDLLDVQNEDGVTPADLIDELKRYDFQDYLDDQRTRCAA